MKKPELKINTDDDMSMSSELFVNVCKTLNRIELTHITQRGLKDTIQIFPSQIDGFCDFLQQSKKWIESGYKKKQKPKSNEI